MSDRARANQERLLRDAMRDQLATEDGQPTDVCQPCAAAERAQIDGSGAREVDS